MPRLFVGNFDFEHRLAYGDVALPRRLEEINAALAPAWTAIAEAGDAIWWPFESAPPCLKLISDCGLPRLDYVANPLSLSERYDLVFWGENAWAQSLAAAWRRPWRGCDPAIVRRVNSRVWRSELERRLEVAPTGLAVARTDEELSAAIGCLINHEWVLKTEFGGAGREVRFGAGSLTQAESNWASNRFRRGLSIIVEPRLDRVDETGLQFQIDRDGQIIFEGITPLLTRPNGTFIGSRYDADESLFPIWQEAIDVGWQVAEATAAKGYFGPLGIDAMRYRDREGAIRVRPLQDLNARYTMGRLALGLQRFPTFAAATGSIFRPEWFMAVSV